jgi:hypothetical protein
MEMTELDETEGIPPPDRQARLRRRDGAARGARPLNSEDVSPLAGRGDAGVTLFMTRTSPYAVHHPKLHDKLQEMLAA